MLRYPCVLFDLDGTLVDSKDDITAAVLHALGRVGERFERDPEDIIAVIGKPLEVVLRELGFHLPESRVAAFVGEFRDYYARHHQDNIRLYPGVEETLSALGELGARRALVTTKQQSQAEAVVRATGLGRYFEHIHGWQEGRRHKPDPEPCRETLTALECGPGSALMVGDSEQDIECARAAGVAACAVTYGYRPAVLLRSYRPDFMVGSIRDVVGIAARPA